MITEVPKKVSLEEFQARPETSSATITGLISSSRGEAGLLFSPHNGTFPYLTLPGSMIAGITALGQKPFLLKEGWEVATLSVIELTDPKTEEEAFLLKLYLSTLMHVKVMIEGQSKTLLSNASTAGGIDSKCGCPNSCICTDGCRTGHCTGFCV